MWEIRFVGIFRETISYQVPPSHQLEMPVLPGLAQGKTTCQDRRILKLAGVGGRPVGQICDYTDEIDTFILWMHARRMPCLP